MTTLLDEAVRRVQTLPDAVQDDYARLLLRLAGEDPSVYRLSPEEERSLDLADGEIARAEFATQAEIDAVLGLHEP